MHTWAIISQKGGQGKTTLATGFAVEAARDGAAVVILDTDDRRRPRDRCSCPRRAWWKPAPCATPIGSQK